MAATERPWLKQSDAASAVLSRPFRFYYLCFGQTSEILRISFTSCSFKTPAPKKKKKSWCVRWSFNVKRSTSTAPLIPAPFGIVHRHRLRHSNRQSEICRLVPVPTLQRLKFKFNVENEAAQLGRFVFHRRFLPFVFNISDFKLHLLVLEHFPCDALVKNWQQ